MLRGTVAPGVAVCPVLKADAYGHGAPAVAARLAVAGARAVAVADATEAATLRAAGFRGAVRVLYAPLPDEADALVRHRATVAVGEPAIAAALAAAARAHGRRCDVELALDVGMGRGGCEPERAGALAAAVAATPGLRLVGACTHFPAVRAVPDTTRAPYARFAAACDALAAAGHRLAWRHAANSAACFLAPGTHGTLVRPGLALYGVAPAGASAPLRPALAVRARVIAVVDVPAGGTIGYHPGYTAPRATRIAVLPIGYADGYAYRLGNRGRVLLHGAAAPVVGPVSMDCTAVEIGQRPVRPGDVATLLGRDGSDAVTADELAAAAGTIPYEILTRLGNGLPRVYR